MMNLKFNKSFDEALQQAYRFHIEILTDMPAFSAFSTRFEDPFADNFLTDVQAADALPTYEHDMAQQGLLTQRVKDKMNECRQYFQKFMFFVKNTWPDNEAIAKVFGSAEYLKARNVQLRMINLIQNAYNNANSITYKADLIAAGFVQANIDLLDSLADGLISANNAQEDFKRNTFERTETKIIAFNKVWDSMALISDASKLIFKDSPAMVEYYLLYPDTPTSNPPGVPALSYAPTGFFWEEIASATSYQLEYKAAGGGAWIQLFAGPYPAGSVPFDPGSGSWVARLRARNSGGYGDWSEEITVVIA